MFILCIHMYIKEYKLQISQSYEYYSKQINSMGMISVNGFFPPIILAVWQYSMPTIVSSFLIYIKFSEIWVFQCVNIGNYRDTSFTVFYLLYSIPLHTHTLVYFISLPSMDISDVSNLWLLVLESLFHKCVISS